MRIKSHTLAAGCLAGSLLTSSLAWSAPATLSGDLQKWHKVTLTFEGPSVSESGSPNPFRDFRLNVTFYQGGKAYGVPGYYAADGRAADSSADSGNRWRVHFTPDATNVWTYVVSFRTGPDIAVSADPQAGVPTDFDGLNGHFTVVDSDKSIPDFRARGRLQYVGKRYLQFAGSREYFLKGGADSPENFLAYYEFDQTPLRTQLVQRAGEAKPASTHHYEAHRRDWRAGDPTWQDGKGRNIMGALNYLAGKGMNSVYFLTMNVGGDGDDVWPWTSRDERFRFDCSKLDQWEIVFSHMDQRGLMLHVVTQETENDQLLDGGELGPERRLYYRELVARFGHHLALTWNLGEENTNTTDQQRAFARYLRALDPYGHPIVVHTYPNQYDKVYTPLLGFEALEGPSLQVANMKGTHAETLKWIDRSAKAGRPWIVCLDEIGPPNIGVKPDLDDLMHDLPRQYALWGNLMAGGAGVEWYFGYQFPNNDLNCEEWSSRDRLWNLTRYALEFFQQYLPFPEMQPHDELTSETASFCLAKPGEVYAVYLPPSLVTELQIEKGTYDVHWYNPRTGGPLQTGSLKSLTGPGPTYLGRSLVQTDQDWVALVRRQK